jgi:hypothetical protein
VSNPPDDKPKDSNIVFFIQEILDRHIKGKVSIGALERYEMMELGFDPNKPEDVKKYKEFIDSTFKEFIRATSENPDMLVDYFNEPDDDDEDYEEDEDYEKDIEFIPEFELDDDEEEEEEDK